MRNKEESKISTAISKRLDIWEMKGVVVFHDRYNAGKIQVGYNWLQLCKDGHCDRIAFISFNKLCWLYLIEVKKEGGKQTKTRLNAKGKEIEGQEDWEKRFKELTNVVYEVVDNPQQIDATIERITNHDQDILEKITL